MVISSCTASPEAVAICGNSFGTQSALRQASVPTGIAALSATMLLGGRKAAQDTAQVEVVGSATLVREQGQGDALNPAASMYGIYGIDKAKLEALQDIALLRYCASSGNSQICQNLRWFGLLQGFPYIISTDRPPTSVNQVTTSSNGDSYYRLEYDQATYPGYGPFDSTIPWELKNTASEDRRWATVGQDVRDAAVDLLSPEEQWSVVEKKGTLGQMAYPAGYDPNSPSSIEAAGPMSIEISGTDRIFRQPQAIPGTTAVEIGGPLIQEGSDRRVGAGYPGISGFVDGSQPGIDVGQRTKPLTFAGTGTTGGAGQYQERKVGFPLPGADGQLDSDDEISIPPTDICVAPCIQDIKKKLDFATDYCEELWEYFLDYSLEDYRLPPNNFFFDIGSGGHPLDTVIGASIIREQDVPASYGQFLTNFAIAPFYPKNIGLLQFEYAPNIDRGQGELGVTGFRIRSEPQQVRGFSLVYSPTVQLPCKAVGWSPRTDILGRLRVFVRRYQLKQ